MSPAQLVDLAPKVQTAVAQCIAAEGVTPLSQRLNVRRETLLRLASGADTHEATLLLAAVRLGLLTVNGPALSINMMPPAGDMLT